MNQFKLVSLIVHDYDAAVDFYTRKLGFELREDQPFGEERWVTLGVPGSPGIALALVRAKTAEDRERVGKQGGSFPLLGLETADCAAEYRRMKALGVAFEGEPEARPWGTGVTLQDLYGNRIHLNQEPA